MKKLIVSVLTISALCLTGCSDNATVQVENTATGNFSDEMKIPYTVDMDETYGADSVERTGDHENSPYFISNDYYTMESTDSLTILSGFKTQQQTSEWSCGISAMMMAMEHYDMLGDYNEDNLSAMRTNGQNPGATTLIDIVNIFEEIGFDTDSTYDYTEDELYEYMTFDKIQETLANNQPILVAWNDWGGHWQVIIGYDNMGTPEENDDVIIMADSYDTTDHNQDGYGVYPAERFYYNWTMYDFFSARFDLDERDMLFCIPSPSA